MTQIKEPTLYINTGLNGKLYVSVYDERVKILAKLREQLEILLGGCDLDENCKLICCHSPVYDDDRGYCTESSLPAPICELAHDIMNKIRDLKNEMEQEQKYLKDRITASIVEALEPYCKSYKVILFGDDICNKK